MLTTQRKQLLFGSFNTWGMSLQTDLIGCVGDSLQDLFLTFLGTKVRAECNLSLISSLELVEFPFLFFFLAGMKPHISLDLF